MEVHDVTSLSKFQIGKTTRNWPQQTGISHENPTILIVGVPLDTHGALCPYYSEITQQSIVILGVQTIQSWVF